jgi:hypothetical protein
MITDLGGHAFCVVVNKRSSVLRRIVDRRDGGGRQWTAADVTSGSTTQRSLIDWSVVDADRRAWT